MLIKMQCVHFLNTFLQNNTCITLNHDAKLIKVPFMENKEKEKKTAKVCQKQLYIPDIGLLFVE